MRPQRRVDLHRLPVAVQYAIALFVVAVVVAVALSTSGGDEGPAWLGDTLAPILGVLGIAVAIGLLADRVRRRRR